MDKDLNVTMDTTGLTVVMIAVGAEDHLAEDTPVYHRDRREWGVSYGPSLHTRATHWVAFGDDGEDDSIQVSQVSNELLDVPILRRAGAEDQPDGTVATESGPEVLEVRWGIQIEADSGDWHDYSQSTWPDAEKHLAEQSAATMYGGEVDTRLFKVVKMVDPGWKSKS